MATYTDIMQAASATTFQDRIRYALTKSAIDVLAEDPATGNHGARRAYAVKILSGSFDSYAATIAVLTNPTIAASVDPTLVPDGDIQFTVNSIFTALAAV